MPNRYLLQLACPLVMFLISHLIKYILNVKFHFSFPPYNLPKMDTRQTLNLKLLQKQKKRILLSKTAKREADMILYLVGTGIHVDLLGY